MRSRLLTALCILLVGCSGGRDQADQAAQEPAATPPAHPAVHLELTESIVEAGRLRLHGTTDVPDGAQLRYRVEHDGFATGDFDGQLLGELTVEDGAFSADLDVDNWPTGYALTWISLEMNGQPENVIEAYGANGERLAGPNVVHVGDRKKLEIEVDVPIP